MKPAMRFLTLLVLLSGFPFDSARAQHPQRLPPSCETVMSAGMKITATTTVGTIAVTAIDELTRAYTWDGATRAVVMAPRATRWYGSLGLCNPGAGEHWRDHHGITRGVTEEGQQHFKTVEEALKWIEKRNWMPFVYRNDGLMIGWKTVPARKQLSVEVWQILIDGKKPKKLPGSQDNTIVVETIATETVPLVKAVARNDLGAVTALLAKGANANAKNSVQIPVLVIAIRQGSAPIVEALLKKKADPNVRDVDTDSVPLMEALDREDLIKLLLAAGADVNAASRKEGDLLMGMTPLMLAAFEGDEKVVRLLLDKGADVNAKTPGGDTALSLAKWPGSKGHERVIGMLEAALAKARKSR